MSSTLKLFEALCTPAQLYLGMSVIAVLTQCYQNIGTPNVFTCGLMKASSPIVPSSFFIVFEILYVIGWTYFLNILCKKGYTKLSWLLVLLPFVGMFVIIGLIILGLQTTQGL